MNAHQRRTRRRAQPSTSTCGTQGYSGTTRYPDLMCIDGVMRDMDADGWCADVVAEPCKECDPKGWEAWRREQLEDQGVYLRNGKFMATCCACEKEYACPVDPITEGWDEDMAFCGGSERCCP